VKNNTNPELVITSIYANGVLQPESSRQCAGQRDNRAGFACECVVTVAGGQAIDARWRVTDDKSVGSTHERVLILLKMA